MPTANMRVLIVDDEFLVRDVCSRILKEEHYSVCAVSGAVEARAALATQSFDILLLDLHIPEVTGMALLEEIRASDRRLPILIITGTASVEHAAKAMRLGAQGLLLKPFTPQMLRDTVADILRQRRDMRAHDRVTALRPVVQISQRLLAELDLPRLQNLIIDTVRTELEADRASLMLLEEDGQALRVVALSGLPPNVQLGHRVRVERSLAGWVATNRQLLVVDKGGEVSPPAPHLRGVFAEDNIVSAISVPLIAGERVLGVLNAAKLYNGPIFTEDDQELLVLLAAQAAIAIENARLYTAVSHSEERYRALLQHATDGVLLLDRSGNTILDTNLAFERLSGYRREELLKLEPHRLLAELETWPPKATHQAAGNGRYGDNSEIETVIHTRWDQAAPVAISVSAVPYDGQDLLLVLARDTSERQRIAKQLLQAEKLAAIGRLSASMAHEINNPLQAINNSVHLLLTRSLPDEKRQRYLEMTRDEVLRLIDIVRRMLDFYRPSREGMRPTNMNELLETVLTLIEGQLQSGKVEVTREWQPKLPLVYAISNHLKQVCFSLIFNAIEAMPEGGQIHIRTYLADEGDADNGGYVSVSGLGQRVSGQAVVIEFSDNGAGMPPAELTKIFEPFYTTRIKGTGLGLAVSYSIIEQHHGELSVRSDIGSGTTFRIKLPIAT